MEADKQSKIPVSRILQPKSPRGNIGIVDKRPQAAGQAKLIETIQKRENRTGLPDNLKTGVENLSGFSLDDVRVHYNSSKPAQLQALAYTQGAEIHIGTGQEKYLPHEVWHVVQQKQGRVQPTVQLQGMSVNDNDRLEKEADDMGEKITDATIFSSLGENSIRTGNESNVCQFRLVGLDWYRFVILKRYCFKARWAAYQAANLQEANALYDLATNAERVGLKLYDLDFLLENWAVLNFENLIREFNTNDGGKSIEVWVQIANVYANHVAEVSKIARIPNWEVGRLVNLLGEFVSYKSKEGKRSIEEWVQIANVYANHETEVSEIARVPDWEVDNLVNLLGEFVSNNGGRSIEEWVKIANVYVDHETEVSEIARVPNWAVDNLVNLLGKFVSYKSKKGKRSIEEWVQIANVYANYETEVSEIARIAKWDVDNLVELLKVFVADNGGRSIEEWVQIVNVNNDLSQLNVEEIEKFARMKKWEIAKLVKLVNGFVLKSAFRSLDNWLLIANEFPDDASNTIIIAQFDNWKDVDTPKLINMIKLLKYDNLQNEEIQTLLSWLNKLWNKPSDIEKKISELRGNMDQHDPPTDAENPITTANGQQILSGKDLLLHMKRFNSKNRNEVSNYYPIGEKFNNKTGEKLWNDCQNKALYHDRFGHEETAEQILIRQKLALNSLMKANSGQSKIIQNIFLHNFGQTPRPFVSVEDEEGYVFSAHTVKKHVLGKGEIITNEDLAHRAGWKSPPVASAYSSIDNANKNIKKLIDERFVRNWPHVREQLTIGLALEIEYGMDTKGVAYHKTDDPIDAVYETELSTFSPRPLIGPKTDADADKVGLTYDVSSNIDKTKVTIASSDNLDAHGWGILRSFQTVPKS